MGRVAALPKHGRADRAHRHLQENVGGARGRIKPAQQIALVFRQACPVSAARDRFVLAHSRSLTLRRNMLPRGEPSQTTQSDARATTPNTGTGPAKTFEQASNERDETGRFRTGNHGQPIWPACLIGHPTQAQVPGFDKPTECVSRSE